MKVLLYLAKNQWKSGIGRAALQHQMQPWLGWYSISDILGDYDVVHITFHDQEVCPLTIHYMSQPTRDM